MRFVRINNRIWALGLHWKLAPALSRKQFIEKALSLDESFDLLCRHKRQYGFGASALSGAPDTSGELELAKVKMPIAHSLAAYLHIPSLIGMFKLEDLDGIPFWWVVAIRDHSIVGTGDQVFGSENDAEEAVLNLNEIFGADLNDTIIQKTPAESIDWLSPHLRLDFVENILGRARITSLVEDTQKKRQKTIICALVAIVFLVGSWSAWTYYVEQKSINEQLLTQIKNEQNKRELLSQPEKQFKQEWANLPLASEIANSCLEAMQEIPVNINGWSLDILLCLSGKSLQIAWKHQDGASFINLPMKAALSTPQKAVSRMTLPVALPSRPKQDFTALLPLNKLEAMFYQICQATGTKLNLSVKDPQEQTIDKIKIICPWQKVEWTFSQISSLLILDKDFAQILAKIPGLCLSSISFESNRWTFKGSVYVLK